MSRNAARKWKYWIVAGIACVLVAAAYTPARQFHRFFMTPCAADGPARETELDIDVATVDVARFYEELREAAAGLPIEQIATASHAGSDWPIYLIGESAPTNVATLVIAGVHGNEVSGSLAAGEVLRSMREPQPRDPPLLLLAPANPVGLAAGSRYNSQGCDVNRDFAAFRTIEARAIRSAIDRVRPRLVVSLHEGPQEGVFIIGTQITPQALLERVMASLQEQRIPLASENNLGIALSTPGIMSEGSFITRAKGWLGIYSVGEYTSPLGIPLVTVEVPWSWPDMRERIAAQTTAVQAAARYDP
jgi:hypothetical protein